MKKVYLSGGFVTGWQEEVEARVEADFYNPEKLKIPSVPQPYSPDIYAPLDRIAIENSDIVFGYLEASNPTPINIVAEMCYAKGLGKITILCNEWTEERFKAKELKTQFTSDPESNDATWFKIHYLDLVLNWMDFVETDFGIAIEILKKVI
jgi:hypothetical protein